MEYKEKIEKRLQELRAEFNEFLLTVAKKDSMYRAAIGELEHLLLDTQNVETPDISENQASG